MGRRRERRQATSRRTKLDLFMDDTQEIEAENAVAGDQEQNLSAERAAAPPSKHSGVQENPLSLLGQYSDDEDEAKNPKSTVEKFEDKKIDAKVADFMAELETSGLLESSEEQEQNNGATPVEETIVKNERSKASIVEQENAGSMATMIGDLVQKVLAEQETKNSDWRAVLHEETGEYFYWNVITGATTWEKPEGSVELADPDEYSKAAQPGSYGGAELGSSEAPGFQSAETTDPATLIQLAETIYTRFKVLSGESLLLVPLRARLAIEAEIRLSDCRLLASQGCSEGASWSITEAHMKRLDSLLAVEEAALLAEMERRPVADEDVDMDVDMEIEGGDAPPLPPEDPPPPEPEVAPLPLEEFATLVASELNGDSGEGNRASSSSPSSAAVKYSEASVPSALLEAAAAAKKKSVTRVKKGNASLSSGKVNKRVSSLVNKWIAAKEELHESGSEDEDNKALYNPQAQERKRQKELEDWRRGQIASGQALENANFQPLGPVDWRERVKRARKGEKSKTSTNGVQHPNLELLSKGLAPGWKAYWDESSKEVYYGNLSTSETTWDRPVG